MWKMFPLTSIVAPSGLLTLIFHEISGLVLLPSQCDSIYSRNAEFILV